MADWVVDPAPEDHAVVTQWKTVLQQMPAGVILARAPDGRVIFGNDAAEVIWRQPISQTASIGGYGFWRGYHRDGRPYQAEEWPLARSLRTGEVVVSEEIEIERGDGTRGVVSVNSTPILDEAGAVVAAVVTFTDVTERRRYESERRFLSRASAVLSSSLDYSVTVANVARLAVPTLCDWCGVDIVQGNGSRRLAVEHVDPGKLALAKELGEKYPVERSGPAGAGEVVREGNSALVPVIDDDTLREVAQDEEHLRILREVGLRSAMIVPLTARGVVLGDITLVSGESGREFDARDLALAEELAALAALAIDNARLYDESQSANRAKADFLSVISHELRTPLTAVIGYAELLALGIPEPVTERQLEQVERIEIAARHLLQLIEEILTIANLEAGTVSIRIQSVALSEILRRAEAIVRPLALEKKIAFSIEPLAEEITLETDPDRLLQIFLNLLSNAVKFTDTGSIVLSVRPGDEFIEVAVRDTGVGITPEQKGRIFDAFWQAEQPITRRAGGTGLGLTISRRLLDLLGGKMDVVSEPGLGSTFTARIPLRQ
ncbi:MAG: GAF domain-containing protein [Gemmatimonadetes bacterium]|nr:GAF domain-containing protein [Gemmatimonadota bacterium]